MSGATDYLEKKLVDHSLGIASYTMPTAVYLALFTADPTDTGSTSNEVSGGSYARQSITASMAAAGATNGTSSNSLAITFPSPSANWGVITHIGIMDAVSGGNMLYYGALEEAVNIVSGGAVFELPAGELSITLG